MSNAEARAGFTLIEMMAVMMIIALVAALVVTFIPGTGRPGLKAVVMNTVSLLRRERLVAILTGGDRHVALDGEHRVLVGDGGDQVLIPSDVSIDILGTAEVWSGLVAVAVFHPDGASSGGALKFSREGVAYEVRINWYTGGVAIKAQ
ncbi:prepilin-type N-terminal cleavage/methylation domain-containing protein [Methyloferula stellata]|uniref:prepilin-type N-terminal cleavage/methylation domain-containing protein n=1 Tax=Methyloferula stellata TaxID=876270 RepID=UPI000368BAC5|nr:prepilin-type N-terminal cleavage/methylation domain-containing protein [Methyloferula stellata]